MGSGILQVILQAGLNGIGVEPDEAQSKQAFLSIRKGLNKAVEKGKLTGDTADAALTRLTLTDDLKRLAECQLVVEAVPEQEELKAPIFRQLSGICGTEAIVATNTSSLSVTRLMLYYVRPERFAGLHFFNPAPVMGLVEVVETLAVRPETIETLAAFVDSLGKTAVRCQDRTGFLVNRLLIPYLLDAVRALETGTGSMADIDLAMKLGCSHPMGPFQLMDFIGLDTVLRISEVLFDEFGESRMAAPPLLKRLVYSGRLGRKSGTGFYSYPAA